MALGWRVALCVSLLAVSFCAADEDSREAHISAQHAAKVGHVAFPRAAWAAWCMERSHAFLHEPLSDMDYMLARDVCGNYLVCLL